MAALAWGVLAFGAVYPWAYTPLAIACGIIGAASLAVVRPVRPPMGALAAGFAAVAVAIGAQLIPLPPALLAAVSPSTPAFLSRYDLSYAQQPAAGGEFAPGAPAAVAHSISVDPGKT